MKSLISSIEATSSDILFGVPNLIAIGILLLGYQFDIKNTETDNLVVMSLAMIVFGLSFLFSAIKKEYPLFFRARLKGVPAQAFGTTGVLLSWGIALWIFFVAIR